MSKTHHCRQRRTVVSWKNVHAFFINPDPEGLGEKLKGENLVADKDFYLPFIKRCHFILNILANTPEAAPTLFSLGRDPRPADSLQGRQSAGAIKEKTFALIDVALDRLTLLSTGLASLPLQAIEYLWDKPATRPLAGRMAISFAHDAADNIEPVTLAPPAYVYWKAAWNVFEPDQPIDLKAIAARVQENLSLIQDDIRLVSEMMRKGKLLKQRWPEVYNALHEGLSAPFNFSARMPSDLSNTKAEINETKKKIKRLDRDLFVEHITSDPRFQSKKEGLVALYDLSHAEDGSGFIGGLEKVNTVTPDEYNEAMESFVPESMGVHGLLYNTLQRSIMESYKLAENMLWRTARHPDSAFAPEP